jgi:hypothetical protein
VDVNECSDSPCDHTCVNIPGGFHCECEEGYDLDGDGVSCNGEADSARLERTLIIISFPYTA